MKFAELAFKRRSTRVFKPELPTEEILAGIVRTFYTAGSSKNCKSSRLAVITDKSIISRLGTMRTTGTAFVKDAPLVFAVMGDENLSDLWRINSSISATVLQYAIESAGMGSCWVQVDGRPHKDDEPEAMTAEDYLKELMPSLGGYRILCLVAAGYPDIEPKPRKEPDTSQTIYIP